MRNIKRGMQRAADVLKNKTAKYALVAVGVASAVATASAQIDTNAPTVITNGVAGAYNTAAGLGIAAIVVGTVVFFIRKGVSVRK